jgi:hypothetical protein
MAFSFLVDDGCFVGEEKRAVNLGLKNFVVRSQKFNGARGFVASEFGGLGGIWAGAEIEGEFREGIEGDE